MKYYLNSIIDFIAYLNNSVVLKKEKKVYFKYDSGIVEGTANFFHFMWGYLLPSINEIIKLESDENPPNNRYDFFFDSRNEVMDKITKDLLNICGYNYQICQDQEIKSIKNLKHIKIPRWDTWIINYYYYYKKPSIYINKMLSFKWLIDSSILKRKIKMLRYKLFVRDKKVNSDFTESINLVKSKIDYLVEQGKKNGSLDKYINKYLLIKRSVPTTVGNNSKFGSAKRDLKGIDESLEYFKKNNIAIEVFEPGKYGIIEQIRVFKNCKGIIGIRGSEFSNILWLKPSSKVILIESPDIGGPSPAVKLSQILNLNYIEINSQDTVKPKLDPHLIINYLN